MENIYHYYAFISYATADSKWAKWLQHQLSYYHIPAVVKKNNIGIPQKIRPIFIYEYDLAGNQLHKAIEQELTASKYLIVICSPNSAKSKYVNNEIQTFINQGRAEYIIPFIIDGKVNASNPDEECFPPALLSLINGVEMNKELRGVNIATKGKRQALVDVVAAMLSVRRDLLWNRYKVSMIRKRVILSILLILALLCGIFYWDYTRPTYEYFADYVDVWGVPTGVVKLNDDQIAHRYGVYRFKYRRLPIGIENPYTEDDRRVVAVDYVNSQGSVIEISQTEHFNRYPMQSLSYNDKKGGRIENITYSTHEGKPVVMYEFSDNEGVPAVNVDIKNVSIGGGTAHSSSYTTIKADSDEIESKAKITRYRYYRDEMGHIKALTYHRNNDRYDSSLISDADGVCGQYYALDSLGRITHRYYVNKDMERHVAASGVSVREYEYDKFGNISKTICRDLNDSLVNNDCGWAIGISLSNEYGNSIEEFYLNSNREPCFATDFGYHKVVVEYGDNNVPNKMLFLDSQNNLCVTKKGHAQLYIKSDKLGRIEELKFYDAEGNPCFDTDLCCHSVKFEYSGSQNQLRKISCYGFDNKLCNNKEGYASLVLEYTSEGYPYISKKYDENNELTFDNEGVSITYYHYYQGRITEILNYGVDGILREDYSGCAKYKLEYDDKGNVSKVYNLDIKSQLTNNNKGFAILVRQYNDFGQQESVMFYDQNGQPCIDKEQACARIELEYDDFGNVARESYWNEKDSLCIGNSVHAAAIEYEYDERKNIIKKTYYNEEYKPMMVDGAVREEYVYNALNQLVECRYYSNELDRIERYKYDDMNRQVQIDYYDSRNKRYLANSQAVMQQIKYEGYKCVEQAFYKENGVLANGPDGYAKISGKFDERGNIVERLYFDEKGSLRKHNHAREEMKYNSRNQLIYHALYNHEDKFTIGDEGYAQYIESFDKLGNSCDFYKLDEEGNMMLLFDDVARIQKEFDERGNQLCESCYNTENQLCNRMVFQYNKTNDVEKILLYNSQNELVHNGIAIVVYEYDDDGNLLSEMYYDKDEKLCLCDGMYAITRKVYYNNTLVGESYYDAEDVLCKGPNGYAKATVNDEGVVTYYDEYGKDITNKLTN